MIYSQRKGLNETKPEKTPDEKFLLPSQVGAILSEIESADMPDELQKRDHAIVYLAFHLGLRSGEVPLLSRDAFRRLDKGIAFIRTLKKTPRLSAKCECGRRFRVGMQRMGDSYPCPRCGTEVDIPMNEKYLKKDRIPEVQIPIPEDKVIDYISGYLGWMPSNQHYLFIANPHKDEAEDRPVCVRAVTKIFSTWLIKTDLSNAISFHALRHGRGVQLYEATQNLNFVQTCLRHESMATSQIYVHLSPQAVEQHKDALNERAIG